MGGLRALLAAVIIGGSFGSASATVESIDDETMVVEISVEVLDSADSVVAHLTFGDDRELTLPLLDRDDGTFGLRTELEPKNYFVVFETIGEDAARSEPVSLSRMGAELGPGTGATATTIVDDDDLSDDSEQMLWLAVALAAASLSLLAFWVLGDREDEQIDDATEVPPEHEEE